VIAVIDYGAGNLRSVANALDLLKTEYRLVSKPEDLEGAGAILLPGVGHFGQMMAALNGAGLVPPLRDRLRAGLRYFGICLGMQALYETSEEAPGLPGLSLLRGAVQRFPAAHSEKVPHMGWSAVSPGAQHYYFAHSYYVPAGAEGVAATVRHGLEVAAIVRRGNLFGTQFHPEKSGPAGLALLQEWVNGCRPSASSPAST
jgi:imidazole glycerol phosphate synthase glutamine amidotransferase subunit